jgi:nucleoside phosphorylase
MEWRCLPLFNNLGQAQSHLSNRRRKIMKIKKPITRLAVSKDESSKRFDPSIHNTPSLPAVNWAAVGQSAPQPLSTPSGDLPKADVIVITWAEAEWAALEHVFCNSATSMSYSVRNTDSWSGWENYTKGFPSGSGVSDWTYWGSYRLVKIGSKTVILFKSNTHLDHPGQQYLAQMITRFITIAQPGLIMSIGTAGGARTGDHVGTVNVVNAGTLFESGKPENQWSKYSNQWAANWNIISQAGFKKLLFPVPTTSSDLQSLCSQFNSSYNTNYSLNELNVNNLNMGDPSPAINNLTSAGTSLLTTDSFVVATNAGNFNAFACVEMDDAIIANVCQSHSTAFGFVRNISDPVQNSALPSRAQGNWGSAVYDTYGLYTSYNGAIAAWGIIAGS